MIDIPLEHATLLWSDGVDGVEPFAVVADYRKPSDKFRSLDNSRGACDAGWAELDTAGRIAALQAAAWSALVRDGYPIQVLHAALLQVPEYRRWVDRDVPGIEKWDSPE